MKKMALRLVSFAAPLALTATAFAQEAAEAEGQATYPIHGYNNDLHHPSASFSYSTRSCKRRQPDFQNSIRSGSTR